MSDEPDNFNEFYEEYKKEKKFLSHILWSFDKIVEELKSNAISKEQELNERIENLESAVFRLEYSLISKPQKEDVAPDERDR